MDAESEYYEGHLAAAAEKAEFLIKKHPEKNREIRMARILAALSYRQQGDNKKAVKLLEENVAHQYRNEKQENFGDHRFNTSWDSTAMSMQWLVKFAKDDKDTTSARKWTQKLMVERPKLGKTLKLDKELIDTNCIGIRAVSTPGRIKRPYSAIIYPGASEAP